MGTGLGWNKTVAKLAVRVVNEPELSTRVQYESNFPTIETYAGSLQVAQRVHPKIHTRLLTLQFDDSGSSKSCIEQPMIGFSMFGSLWYQLYWNPWFSLDILHIRLWRQRIVLFCAWISTRCLDYEICQTKHCWHSVYADFQDAAGSVWLLFLPLNADNSCSMDVCNQSELRFPKMQS